MRVTAKLSHLRIAPRKTRLVAELIRGKPVEDAQTILSFTSRKAAFPLLKLLSSAIANAVNNFQLESANLFVAKVLVDEGPKYKRWRARSRGQANEIQKKTSHITIVLDEIQKESKKIKKIKKAAEAAKIEKIEKMPKPEKPRPRPIELSRPQAERGLGLKRIFRRKSF